jgi:hypothetical protein
MTIQPVAFLQLAMASDAERDLIDKMVSNLDVYLYSNDLKAAYYEGEQRVQMLDISIPPALSRLETVVGWPGMVVDVLDERLDFYGWHDDDQFELKDIYAQNNLAVESQLPQLDALIFGISFVVVGSGLDGEPSPLITTHSPTNTTGMWSTRERRLTSALSTVSENGAVVEVTLYTPNETAIFARDTSGGVWRAVDRDRHNLGRVPVVPFFNRPRASRTTGRSEISKAVRYYTDAAVRTMLGMEVNREFYSAPQRYALGVSKDDFVGADGTARTGWETIMGRVWAIDRDEDGNLPEVGQFTAASPAPYLDQVRGLGQLVAAEAGIPPAYLGFQTDNPASADAIQRSEARLVKRAERRQASFGKSWLDVGRLALLMRDGSVPDDYASVAAKWRDAATPTNAAAADAAVKLVGANILLPESSVTLDRVGLTPEEQTQLAADRRRAAGSGILASLASAAAQPAVTNGDDAGTA